MRTVASPAPDGVLRFVSANEKAKNKNKVEDEASKKVSATRQEIQPAMEQLAEADPRAGKDAQAETDCTGAVAGASAIH